MRPGPTLDDNLFTSMTTFSPMDVTFGKAARSGEHHRAGPRSASVRTRDIQIDVGSPAVAPRTVDWKKTRL